MDFECQLMRMAVRHGFHGIHFADDWGAQSGLIISPSLWRKLFIGYVEEYSVMGMSAENYRACGEAFRRLPPPT